MFVMFGYPSATQIRSRNINWGWEGGRDLDFITKSISSIFPPLSHVCADRLLL
jgi:hypothetical protein